MLKNQNNLVSEGELSLLVDFDLTSDFIPELILYNVKNKKESRLLLKEGTQLNWYVQPDHFCIGYHVKDEYHSYIPCPNVAKLEKGFQCDSCQKQDLLIPCMLCKGDECHNIDSVKELCDHTPTSVYLVTFGDEVKVGVSKKIRLTKRWIEQGAELAAEVGLFPNGLIARAAEEAVSWNFLITKGIRIKTKFARVETENDEIIDENKFQEIINRVSNWIKQTYGIECVGSAKIHNLNSYYHTTNSKRIDTKGNVALKGKIIGNKGPIFIIEKFGQNFYFDVRSLRGRKIDDNPAIGSQGVLSDFFT